MTELYWLVSASSLAGVLVGFWIAGGFRSIPVPPFQLIANPTPPTTSELNREVE